MPRASEEASPTKTIDLSKKREAKLEAKKIKKEAKVVNEQKVVSVAVPILNNSNEDRYKNINMKSPFKIINEKY